MDFKGEACFSSFMFFSKKRDQLPHLNELKAKESRRDPYLSN